MSAADFAVLIPARNEAQHLERVILGAKRHGGRVVVIDDASTDATAAVARRAGADVVTMPARGGYGAAVLAGLEALSSSGAADIITVDGDGAHDPDEIPAVLAVHRAAGAALTIGDRFASADVHLPSSKRWSNHFAARLCMHACGVALRDVACGFRAYRTGTAVQLLKRPFGPGYAFAYESIAAVVRAGGAVTGAPVTARYDASAINGTSAEELLDFVRALGSMYAPAPVPAHVHALMDAAANAPAFSVRLAGECLCIHRVGDVFLFQAQHAAYAHRVAGSLIVVPESAR